MTTESTPKKSGNTLWYIIAIVVIVIIIVGAVAYYETNKGSSTPTNATPLTLYEGELANPTSTNVYGFSTSSGSSSLTSPGPTLQLTSGTTYKMTVYNIGAMGHNWAIVNAESSTASVQWGAIIRSSSNPIPAGSSDSVTFTAGSAGTYYYICQIPGHVTLGMWGTVIVS
jgi:plastocyanin